jgi:SAM-dependent methyltransferase
MPERPRDYDRFYFETVYAGHVDPWSLASEPERRKHAETLSVLGDRRFDRVLEVGCGEGLLTNMLSSLATELVAVDISQIALDRAAAACAGLENISFQRLDIVEDPLPAGFDLVVCSEVLYYVGVEDLPAVTAKIVDALVPGGLLLDAHLNVTKENPTGIPLAFGAETIAAAFLASGRLSVVDEVSGPVYGISLFERRRPRSTATPRRTAPA